VLPFHLHQRRKRVLFTVSGGEYLFDIPPINVVSISIVVLFTAIIAIATTFLES
jgi:hypothetical protein